MTGWHIRYVSMVLFYVALVVFTTLGSINAVVEWRNVSIRKEEVDLKKNAATLEAAHVQTCLNFQR